MYAVERLKAACSAGWIPLLEVSVLVEGREAPEQGPWYTVVGVMDDGSALNQAVTEIKELGVDRDDLTVVLKRVESNETEPSRRHALHRDPGRQAWAGGTLVCAISFNRLRHLLRHHDAGHRHTDPHGLHLARSNTLCRLAQRGSGSPRYS